MDRELYLTIKETVLEKMDSSRELSDAELMEQIEEELQKTDKEYETCITAHMYNVGRRLNLNKMSK